MKLTMNLGARSYDIILKRGCLSNLYQFTDLTHRKVFILTDSGVPEQYAQTVLAQCAQGTVYTVPQGEGSKCLKTYAAVLQAMLAAGLRRRDLLVAVGGGVVGDLGGFCAASYMRGIDFVNCPTTTLSQIDSSIGGKTGLDLGDTRTSSARSGSRARSSSTPTPSPRCRAASSTTVWLKPSKRASSPTRPCSNCSKPATSTPISRRSSTAACLSKRRSLKPTSARPGRAGRSTSATRSATASKRSRACAAAAPTASTTASASRSACCR